MCLYVLMYFLCITCVQESTEARGHQIPGDGVTGSWELRDVGAKDHTHVLCKRSRHTSPCFQPLNFNENIIQHKPVNSTLTFLTYYKG